MVLDDVHVVEVACVSLDGAALDVVEHPPDVVDSPVPITPLSYVHPGVGGMGLSAAAAAKQHRRRRRRMVVAVVLLGILIVFIIAASSRHRAVVERQTFGEQGQGEAADKITGKDNEFSSATKSNRKPVRLEDVISGKFRPSNFASVNATWISDEEFIFKSFSSGIQVVNVAKPEEASKVVLSGKQLRVYFPYKV